MRAATRWAQQRHTRRSPGGEIQPDLPGRQGTNRPLKRRSWHTYGANHTPDCDGCVKLFFHAVEMKAASTPCAAPLPQNLPQIVVGVLQSNVALGSRQTLIDTWAARPGLRLGSHCSRSSRASGAKRAKRANGPGSNSRLSDPVHVGLANAKAPAGAR